MSRLGFGGCPWARTEIGWRNSSASRGRPGSRGATPANECEGRETEDDDFFIGRVVALDDESISVLYFDPLGRWDDDPSVIDHADITKVQFDTPYINTIARYLNEPPSGFDFVRA